MFNDDTKVAPTFGYNIAKTYDMMFNHWGTVLSNDYLNSAWAYFFFFIVTLVLPLITMRFIITLSTDTLRRVYPRVEIEDYHRKLSYSIEVMEFYRLFSCEKKRRPNRRPGRLL